MTATASRSNLRLQLAGPLLDEVRRAEHRESDPTSPRSISSRRMRPASIVLPMPTSSAISRRGDGQAKRHQQRHELIGARLEGQAARRSGTVRRRAAATGAARRTRRRAPSLALAMASAGRAKRAGRPARVSSAGSRMTCMSASAPESGRRPECRRAGTAAPPIRARARGRDRRGRNSRVIGSFPKHRQSCAAGTPAAPVSGRLEQRPAQRLGRRARCFGQRTDRRRRRSDCARAKLIA